MSKPTYEDIHDALREAWESFFATLDKHGIDSARVSRHMDSKDCFNDVADCAYWVVA